MSSAGKIGYRFIGKLFKFIPTIYTESFCIKPEYTDKSSWNLYFVCENYSKIHYVKIILLSVESRYNAVWWNIVLYTALQLW